MQPDPQVVTGEAVALEIRLAGPGSRGIAALIDFILATLVQIGLLLLVLGVGSGHSADLVVTLLIVSQVGVVVGYPVLTETLWHGKTVGKAIMGLRVRRDDGGPIRFRHALARGLVGVFLDKPGISYAALALIPMIATSRNKRLGDMAAGTIVLLERVPARLQAEVAMPPALAGWAATLDLSRIEDPLAMRMRQFLGRANQLTPTARATLEHQLASDIVSRVGPPPPGAPAWAVISAVLAERRRRAELRIQPAIPLGAADQPQHPSPDPVPTPVPTPPSTTGFSPPA